VKYLPLFHHFKAIYQFPKHRICLVKIVTNASLNIKITGYRFSGTSKHRSGAPMATINMRSRTTDYTAMARVAQKWLQLKKNIDTIDFNLIAYDCK
jgi:hypothetical protein